MVSVILWLLAILAGVIITVLVSGPIHYVLARLFGMWIPRRARGVKGIWCAEYTYESHGVLTSEQQLIELRQFGNYVVGHSITTQAHTNKLQGKIQAQMYFTGTWESTREREVYHGAFQCVMSVSGSHLKGRWLGFNSKHEVDHGPWEWTLISHRLNAAAREKALADFHDTGNTAVTPAKVK